MSQYYDSVLQSFTPHDKYYKVLLLCTTRYYKVLPLRTAKYYKALLLLRTTKHTRTSTTKYLNWKYFSLQVEPGKQGAEV